jgi:preprotein translocase subunit YajC
MEINYWIVIPLIIIILLFLAWLIRRNVKDEKKFEKEANQSDVKPAKHDDNKI